MKKVIFALSLVFIATSIFAQKASPSATAMVELKGAVDSLNYAHGLVAAAAAKRILGNDLNPKLFLEALNAGLKGEPTKFTAENAPKIEQSISTGMWRGNNAKFLDENKKRPGVTTTASGLQYEVMKRGTGTVSPLATDKVEVHYHGTMYTGEIFDSSVDRGQTTKFPLNGVIPGWTEGLQLMKEGDKFKFFIPYNLAYGERGRGPIIKGYSALVFEVELIKVNPQ
ncbi:MAG: FKBP-type peptidyl-prolyl cis-trans isomerase [Saprospiraceae bacterium]|nr:FKBP-type peptidyl-prolyl cis-trans isomerase [Lewinellaceae bacterium]MBP6812015.1 FKBP-type peptidyl-prolyl cis-trans isomerase [Saprospiraceae bacterium]